MKKNKLKYYLFLHIILLQLSVGSILSKFASGQDFMSISFIVLYGLVIINLGVYAILWQQVIKHIPLTTAFCNKAVTIIWGMLWGIIIFGETITWNMLLGAAIVLVGV